MIRHCVMLCLSEGYDRNELGEIMHGLGKIAGRLPGCHSFAAGTNIDLERKSSDFPFGFTIDFDDVTSLRRYGADQEHIMLGGRLVALCQGGDNIVVYDLQVQD